MNETTPTLTPRGTSVEQGLDALVAEHVMGLGQRSHQSDWIHGREPGDGYGDFVGWWCKVCHGDRMPPMVRGGDEKPDQETHYHYRLLPYSASISDAWRVVERMRELGFYFDVQDSIDRQEYSADFWKMADDENDARTWDKSASRAICLAALNALGIKP